LSGREADGTAVQMVLKCDDRVAISEALAFAAKAVAGDDPLTAADLFHAAVIEGKGACLADRHAQAAKRPERMG